MSGRNEAEGKREVGPIVTAGCFPLNSSEVIVVGVVVLGFLAGLLGVYLTMPASDYSFLKLPRNLQDLQILRDKLEGYTSYYTAQVLVGYCMVYIFMQTFMIPGTVFMSLLAGALFGGLQRCSIGCVCCYRWSFFLFLSLQSCWPAYSLLALA